MANDTVQITLVKEDRTIQVRPGTTLLEVQTLAGLRPDAPCAGRGTCGKCLVEARRREEEDWRQVLACQTAVEEGLLVRTLEREVDARVLQRGEAAGGPWDPWVEVVELTMPPCGLGESSADWTRLTDALAAATGRTGWEPNLPLASRLGALLRETGGRLWAAVERRRVLDLWPERRSVYLAAFDIGTTSIAGYLLRTDRREVAARAGVSNPQAQYGADVISRVNFALEHGTDALAACVRQAVDDLLGELCAAAGIGREAVLSVSAVGNTCMHHLLLGLSPASLGRAPYNPAISEALALPAADFGLNVHPAAPLLMPPVIAGFVGADTIGCMVACGWDTLEELTLLIDIGTNGEIVLGDRHRFAACSTAAGPAFEGAKIQCGMRGAAGAVEHVTWEDGQVTWQVIGGGEAVGLCGSGLIDLVAVLRRAGEIDESGHMACGEYRLGETEVVLTQRDVREVQLAKGAIHAGISLLAEHLGAELADIRQVLIAGAFGCYMDAGSACGIGLLPPELRERVRPVGNAAGEGAQQVLRDRAAWERAQALAKQTEFVELASVAAFQDAFVDALEFPELKGEDICSTTRS